MFCKKCGSQIDDKAVICVHCGTQTDLYAAQFITKKKKPLYKRWWFWVLAVFLGFFLLGVIGSSGDSSDVPSQHSSNTVQSSPSQSPQTPSVTDPIETDPPATKPPVTEPEVTVYKSGMYKVGSDIEAGIYFITCTSGNSAYVEVCSDSSGKFSSIVANENVSTFFFISVSDGQYLSVDNGTFVKAEDAVVPGCDVDGNYGAGMYRVGIDIPAGEYKVTPKPGDSFYCEVTSDCSGTFSSIVSNEYSESAIYISVVDGQFLTVDDGTFVFVE